MKFKAVIDKEIEITKEDFGFYERCRQSGITNMFDLRMVENLTGLSREKILVIQEHYEELKKGLEVIE